MPELFANPGHFYSPLCDRGEILSLEEIIWPKERLANDLGIAYNIPEQLRMLASFLPFTQDVTFSIDSGTLPSRYYYRNDQFPCLDAEVLFCFLRHLRPKTVIEVGSGFSSLIMAEVNVRFFESRSRIICIEPFPRQFLLDGIPGISDLYVEKLQFISPLFFEKLGAGDLLFIDSSHVSKTGSDVNHLFFEILPRLQSGVYIHIHDIFLPDDYPKKWVVEDGRSWNEQYLVKAFLQFNTRFEIIWGSYLMATRYTKETSKVFPRYLDLGGGGSLWIRKK